MDFPDAVGPVIMAYFMSMITYYMKMRFLAIVFQLDETDYKNYEWLLSGVEMTMELSIRILTQVSFYIYCLID